MQKISPKEAIELCKVLGKERKTYHINPFFLTHCYKEELNGEILLYEEDDIEKGTYDLIVVPKNTDNLKSKCLIFLFPEEIEKIQAKGIKIKSKNLLGPEYFYKTKDFIDMQGGEFKSFRKKVNRFIREFHPKVLNEYPKEKVKDFILNWAKNKDTSGMNKLQKDIFEAGVRYSLEYVDLSEEIESKSYFVEINNELVGVRLTCNIVDDLWCGVMQKVDYKYKGLARFLYHYVAKDYKDIKYFTTGGGALIENLDNYKTCMHPSFTKDLYFVITE